MLYSDWSNREWSWPVIQWKHVLEKPASWLKLARWQGKDEKWSWYLISTWDMLIFYVQGEFYTIKFDLWNGLWYGELIENRKKNCCGEKRGNPRFRGQLASLVIKQLRIGRGWVSVRILFNLVILKWKIAARIGHKFWALVINGNKKWYLGPSRS